MRKYRILPLVLLLAGSFTNLSAEVWSCKDGVYTSVYKEDANCIKVSAEINREPAEPYIPAMAKMDIPKRAERKAVLPRAKDPMAGLTGLGGANATGIDPKQIEMLQKVMGQFTGGGDQLGALQGVLQQHNSKFND